MSNDRQARDLRADHRRRRTEHRVSRGGKSREPQARAAARLSCVVAPVPRSRSRAGRPISRHCAGLSGLRAERYSRSGQFPYTFDRIAGSSSASSRSRVRALRPVRAGLRRTGRLPARRRESGRARVAHHPELERLRGRLHGGVGRLAERAVEDAVARDGSAASRIPDAARRSRRSTCTARSGRSS